MVKNKIIILLLKFIISLFLFFAFLVFVANVWIVKSTTGRIFRNIGEVPPKKVALILGTSKFSRQGKPNQYFYYRIKAAVDLYHLNKIRHIIVSGDNSLSYYNEPQDMKKALIKLLVPDSIITLDYAGFRTFDSVVRSKKVFKQNSLIIVTQRFHLYRALFISNYYGMDAYGYVAGNLNDSDSAVTLGREVMARFLAILDLYIFNKTPKFLGRQENIS